MTRSAGAFRGPGRRGRPRHSAAEKGHSDRLAAAGQICSGEVSTNIKGLSRGTSRSLAPLPCMKIRSHSESHIVELDDGSRWQIFPGDLDVTLSWLPDTELKVVRIEDTASSHALISEDNSSVRVLPVGDKWPLNEVRQVLKNS
jgi:hypothetical protein